MAAAGLEITDFVDVGIECTLRQLLEHGFFHAGGRAGGRVCRRWGVFGGGREGWRVPCSVLGGRTGAAALNVLCSQHRRCFWKGWRDAVLQQGEGRDGLCGLGDCAGATTTAAADALLLFRQPRLGPSRLGWPGRPCLFALLAGAD